MVRPALLLLLSVIQALSAEKGARRFLGKPDAWFAGEEGRRTTEIILSYQAETGGWPKNTDTVSQPFSGDRATLHATFDNGATTDELRFLARAFNVTKEEKLKGAFNRGLAHILTAQYPNGGWPQYYPPSKQYHRHVTFNDNAMVRLMEFIREVGSDSRYVFVDEKTRGACRSAFDRGIACILRCQIKVDGRPAVWCAQHHAETLEPVDARAFELASFSGAESVGIVRLLMSLDKPGPEIRAAVEGAVAWLREHELKGVGLERKPDSRSPSGTNLVVTEDPKAPPVWARFYDLRTGRPFFCDRDGIAKASIAEIGYERRNGYAWYGDWPKSLLEKDYPAWKERNR